MRPLLTPALFLTILLAAGCRNTFTATRDFSMHEPWQGYAGVVVETRNGGVHVRLTPGADVQISGTLRASGPSPAAAQTNLDALEMRLLPDAPEAGWLTIRLDVPVEVERHSPGAALTVDVPDSCAARIRTSNGSVEVAEMRELEAETSNGSISASQIYGPVTARTSNGRGSVSDIQGDLHLTSSNGSLQVERIAGDCHLRTSNGSLRVEEVQGSVWADSSNGRIIADLDPPADGVVQLETSNGGIRLRLPGDLAADLDLRTSNARVRADFGDRLLKARALSNRHVDVGLNGGGAAKVTAVTSNAAIELDLR